jgi:hypothetical protein
MTLRLPLAVLVGALCAVATASADELAAPRFRAVNVYVDAGPEPLAAYQIEVTAGDSAARGTELCAEVVGVEGGEHPAFRTAPYYDPAALRGGRIVIGALSTDAELPRGRTRVAVLHMRETRSPCRYEARLIAAASAAAERVPAEVSLQPVDGGSHE